jgi:hypothetical protein
MKKYAPLLTLAVVAVLAGTLLAINVATTPTSGEAASVAATTAAAAAAETPAPAATPEPAATPPAVAEKVYAGRSSGNEVTVAVAVKDGKAVAYICDGKKAEAWLQGALAGANLTLSSTTGAKITGTVDETGSFGTVAVGGKEWPYSAKAVQAPQGLYQGRSDVKGVAAKIGWIVLPDGQVGIETSAGVSEPAPPLDPANLGGVIIDGSPVTVTALTGTDQAVG